MGFLGVVFRIWWVMEFWGLFVGLGVLGIVYGVEVVKRVWVMTGGGLGDCEV